MTENKTSRKIKKVILRVLGVLSILQIASYMPLWKHYILSNYMNRVNARFFRSIIPGLGYGLGYIILAFLLAFVVVYVVGIVFFIDTARGRKWKKRIKMGYKMVMGVYIAAVIYLLVGINYYPTNQKNPVAIKGETLSAYFLCASYIVLLVYVIYKNFFAIVPRKFDPMNFAYVVAIILAYLGGGILIPGARPLQTVVFGAAQTMPLIFLAYFEFVYRPVLLTRKTHRRRKIKRKEGKQ